MFICPNRLITELVAWVWMISIVCERHAWFVPSWWIWNCPQSETYSSSTYCVIPPQSQRGMCAPSTFASPQWQSDTTLCWPPACLVFTCIFKDPIGLSTLLWENDHLLCTFGKLTQTKCSRSPDKEGTNSILPYCPVSFVVYSNVLPLCKTYS